MPRLNKIFELQENGLYKTKTDPCGPARSELLAYLGSFRTFLANQV